MVRLSTPNGKRLGVATTWLERLCAPMLADPGAVPAPPVRVPVFLRSGGDFHPPADPATPTVMIGPGTGVAPFR